MVKKFEIWSEGYAATGGSAPAYYHGAIEANSFKEACDKFFGTGKDCVYYGQANLTYWGCRLFDNESEARKSFG